MATILGGILAIGAGTLWLLARSPLGRTIGLGVACFAEAARGEPGALR